MASILDALLGGSKADSSNSNSELIGQLSRQFGISEAQARSAIEQLTPALTRGIEKNTQSQPGMDELLDALRTGNHSRYVDQPSELANPATVDDGNGILGHIFGSKEVSREVANRAAASTGLSATLLKKMLPVVASMVMGTLGKSLLGGAPGSAGKGSTGLLGMLIDRDRDGSIWDDVLGMAARSMLR